MQPKADLHANTIPIAKLDQLWEALKPFLVVPEADSLGANLAMWYATRIEQLAHLKYARSGVGAAYPGANHRNINAA